MIYSKHSYTRLNIFSLGLYLQKLDSLYVLELSTDECLIGITTLLS
jgi:hypothetical protein